MIDWWIVKKRVKEKEKMEEDVGSCQPTVRLSFSFSFPSLCWMGNENESERKTDSFHGTRNPLWLSMLESQTLGL